MNNLSKISLLLFTLSISAVAQNTSVNGTTIGDNPSSMISKPCAIIINPTEKELTKMKGVNGKQDIEADNDNAGLSISIIKSYLDSTKILVIEKDAVGELKFKLLDGKTYVLNLSELYWDVFLFNGENTPTKITFTDFRRQYINYMRTEK